MADIKPYERYKKDRRNQPKKHNIENYSDFQKKDIIEVFSSIVTERTIWLKIIKENKFLKDN